MNNSIKKLQVKKPKSQQKLSPAQSVKPGKPITVSEDMQKRQSIPLVKKIKK